MHKENTYTMPGRSRGWALKPLTHSSERRNYAGREAWVRVRSLRSDLPLSRSVSSPVKMEVILAPVAAEKLN